MFTLKTVKDAYVKCGMKPVADTFFHTGNGVCCPVTALHLAETGNSLKDTNTSKIIAWADSKYGRDKVSSFMIGFDDNFVFGLKDLDTESYRLGKEIREELIDD